jgi:hypothetical protein
MDDWDQTIHHRGTHPRAARASSQPGGAHTGAGCTICTLETLNGRYLFGSIATLFPPAFGVTQPSQLAVAGYHLFNGDGTGTDTVFMPTVMPFD